MKSPKQIAEKLTMYEVRRAELTNKMSIEYDMFMDEDEYNRMSIEDIGYYFIIKTLTWVTGDEDEISETEI